MTIDTIYIDRMCADSPIVDAMETSLNIKGTVVDNPDKVYQDVSGTSDPILRGKSVLFMTRNKGDFIKKCPGTKEYHCCGYQILNIGTFCTMDCSFCILQAYFHPPVLKFFVNHEDLLKELTDLFSKKEIVRIGTGEFTDSLIWDAFIPLSDLLVTEFGKQDSAVLELKTKTANIKRLETLPHNRKTICSWSLNTPRMIRSEERNTASLKARLKSAAQCERWGYPLSFHFDPIFVYDGFEKEYEKVIDMLFDAISPSNVAWISLGTFRFMPGLKPIVESRFKDSAIVYQEFVPGLDGKMRYFKPIRIKAFQAIVNHIRTRAPSVTLYFCMEDDAVWRKTLGFTPKDKNGLTYMLDQSAKSLCALSPALKKPEMDEM